MDENLSESHDSNSENSSPVKQTEKHTKVLLAQITKHSSTLVETITQSLGIADDILEKLTETDAENLSTYIDDIKRSAEQIQQLYHDLQELNDKAGIEINASLERMFKDYLDTSDEALKSINMRIEDIEQSDEEERQIEQDLEEARKSFEDQMRRYEELMEQRRSKRSTIPKDERLTEVQDAQPQNNSVQERQGQVMELHTVEKLAESIITNVNTTHRR